MCSMFKSGDCGSYIRVCQKVNLFYKDRGDSCGALVFFCLLEFFYLKLLTLQIWVKMAQIFALFLDLCNFLLA